MPTGQVSRVSSNADAFDRVRVISQDPSRATFKRNKTIVCWYCFSEYISIPFYILGNFICNKCLEKWKNCDTVKLVGTNEAQYSSSGIDLTPTDSALQGTQSYSSSPTTTATGVQHSWQYISLSQNDMTLVESARRT